MQVISVSCSSGDTEKPVHTPWLQAVPGKKQLTGSTRLCLRSSIPCCTVPHERAGGHGVPKENQGLECAVHGRNGKSGWGLGTPNQLLGMNCCCPGESQVLLVHSG